MTGAEVIAHAGRRWVVPVGIGLFALLCVLINPVGYIGASGDDGRYHEAALCWANSHAVCLPNDHWSSRWPVIAPLAAGIALLGDGRAAMAIGPLLYWAMALLLIHQLGRLWISTDAGRVAASIMAATPVLTSQALQPTADVVELAWQLAALVAATRAYQSQSVRWALAAGVCAGLVFQVRETSALFIMVSALAWLTLGRERRTVLLFAIPALAATIGVEILVYWLATGNPLGRYALAFGHVAIATSELPLGFDTSQSPMFNPAYIAAWKREMLIEWAWPLDPWLNLLASLRIGATLWAAILAAIFFRKLLEPAVRQRLALMGGGALLVSALLIYALALDPKSRLFLLLAAASALIAGAFIGPALRRANNLLAVALLGLVLAISGVILHLSPTIAPLEPAAKRWIAADGDRIETDPTSRGYLIFVPGADRLPDIGSGRPLRLSVTLGTCADKAAAIRREETARVELLKRRVRGTPAEGQFELCLLRISPTSD